MATAGPVFFVVTWGRPGRVDWRVAYVAAFDPDDAISTAAAAFPDRLRPEAAVPASPAVGDALSRGVLPPGASATDVVR